MTQGQVEGHNPVLAEASRELEAAAHDAQVAFDCIALGSSTAPTPTRSPRGWPPMRR
jgi:hypothetical protein